MHKLSTSAVPQETNALIDHILSNYHEMHRADLDSLVPMAERVEQVHADDPDVPKGLARALTALARELEGHMDKEEMILFPFLREGGRAGIEYPLAGMRREHDHFVEKIALIRHLMRDLTLPAHACGTWRSLYGGAETFFDELAAHIALENNVLFPRFESAK